MLNKEKKNIRGTRGGDGGGGGGGFFCFKRLNIKKKKK
jgi:hypothetical protein